MNRRTTHDHPPLGHLLRRVVRVPLVATAALALILTASALPVGTPRAHAVVYGTPAAPSPWAASIRHPGACSGTLIDPEWVITASHCSGSDDPTTWQVTLGNHAPLFTDPESVGSSNGTGSVGSTADGSTADGSSADGSGGSTADTGSLSSDSLRRTGSAGNTGSAGSNGSTGDLGSLGSATSASASGSSGSLGISPQVTITEIHRAPGGADVALLRLPTPVDVAPLPRATEDPAVGTTADFYGYGRFLVESLQAPTLLAGWTEVTGYDDHDTHRLVHNHTVRGGFSLGDSGGPIVLDGELVGVHAGSNHADRTIRGTNPAWYTSVPSLGGWIDDVIGAS